MKLINIILAIGMITCLLNGCNTAQGFGQDMQEGGRAIQKAAHDAEN